MFQSVKGSLRAAPTCRKAPRVRRFRAPPKLVRPKASASVPATSSEITLYHASRRRWLSGHAFASLTDAASGPNPGGATSSRTEGSTTVIYFFLKDQQLLQCEVYPGRPHVFTVIEPGGVEHTELYSPSAQLQARCDVLRLELNEEGWSGPFGRDARV